MGNRLDYDIKEKYSYELNEIADKLQQIESGRLYGYPNGCKMDGSLQLNVKQLRIMIAKLLFKIQHDKDGTEEQIAKMLMQ